MSEKKRRRKWSAAEKLRIVLLGMEPGAEVSEVCRREGLSPTQYYAWKSQLLSSADAVFGGSKPKASNKHREAAMEAKLLRLKSVIAEITAENLELKKTLLD
ncbi:MAG: transposase [Planctomycetota bacterium]